MLILQGGRDYQATVADDLARWPDALAAREDVTHPRLPFTQPPLHPRRRTVVSSRVRTAQHVDPTVVTDIADWLDIITDLHTDADTNPVPPAAEGRHTVV
jgi:hypothetical protein